MRLLYCPCPDRDTAAGIARDLLREGLAACANIVPGITSIFLYEDAIHEDDEVLLLIKTDLAHAARCEQFLIEAHPYDTPVVLHLQPVHINQGAEHWLRETLAED